jgi:hypothetical protein
MRPLTSIWLGVVLFGAAGWSQSSKPSDDPPAATTEAANRPSGHGTPAGPRAVTASLSSPNWEYWVNLTLPAGGWLDLDSAIEFSYSDNVRVTVRCSDGSLTNVELAAYWTVPRAPLFNVADVVRGDSFYYWNVGGATFRTYGTRFRLRIINNGFTGITLSQVLLFVRGQN